MMSAGGRCAHGAKSRSRKRNWGSAPAWREPLQERLIRQRGLLLAIGVLQTAATLATLCLPAADASIIDDGVSKGDTSLIVLLGAGMLAISAIQVICSVATVRLATRAALGFGADLRSALFARITTMSAEQRSRFGGASLLARINTDVQRVQNLTQTGCTLVIGAAVTGVGGLLMAVRQDLLLSCILLVAMPALAVIIYAIASPLLVITRRSQRLLDSINQFVRQYISGIRVIRAYAREACETDRFAHVNRALATTLLAADRRRALIQPASTLVLNASSIALVWVGGLRTGAGHMPAGSLIACISYAMLLLSAVLSVSLLAADLPETWVSAERIGELLASATDAGVDQAVAHVNPIGGVIVCHEIAFSYPGAERPTLHNVSFESAPGTATAIVGPMGSGKSSLIGLFCRLLDASTGSITLDGTDIRHYGLDHLRAAIGWVPQRGYLFAGTVADNLRVGRVDATDAQIWAALRVAAADGFVREHPEGLHMPIAQGGTNVSGGQRQRLAIARAVIRDPALFLLDDAFRSMDLVTQAAVWRNLRGTHPEATIVVATQTISIAARAEQIIVVDGGTVVGAGSHASLSADCPTYRALTRSQMLSIAT